MVNINQGSSSCQFFSLLLDPTRDLPHSERVLYPLGHLGGYNDQHDFIGTTSIPFFFFLVYLISLHAEVHVSFPFLLNTNKILMYIECRELYVPLFDVIFCHEN